MTHPGESQYNTAGPWDAATQTQQQWPYQQAYQHAYQQEQATVLTARPARGPGSRRTKLAAALAAAVLGLAGGAAWAGLSATSASADEVALEPVAYAGDSPFLPPVGQDKTDVTPPAGTGGEFKGDTPGLYAESDTPSCDTKSLVSGLQADGVKSAAWAKAMGIEPAGIPKFVNSLSPVLLRSDTAVTNHGFRAGTFAPSQAVLQAGTAVLINSYGEPTVKCFSGNPLTKPVDYDVTEVEYVGARWASWEPTYCTFVEPTTIVIKTHIFIDYEDHRPTEKPGKPDTKEHPGPNPKPDTHQPETKPDPAKEMAAMEARKAAEMAAEDAADKRSTADDRAVEARIFDTEARNLEDKAKMAQDAVAEAQAKFDATTDPFSKATAQAELLNAQIAAAQAQQMATEARTTATEKANQAKYADAAARSAEGTRDAAEAAAKMKQDDADKAAGRTPATDATPPAEKKQAGDEQGDGTVADAAQDTAPPAGTAGTAPPAGTAGTDGTDGTGGTGNTGIAGPGTGTSPFMQDGPQAETDAAPTGPPVGSTGGDGAGAAPQTDGPAAGGPTAGGPTASGPTASGPTANGPTASGPTTNGPTASGPTASGPSGGSGGSGGGGSSDKGGRGSGGDGGSSDAVDG